MFRNLVLLILVLACSGCATTPFKGIEYVSLESANPQEVRNKFTSFMPLEFQALNTIVFRYRFISLFALGYTKVDAATGNFAVSCFNPAGIKLFELTGNADTLKRLFTLDLLAKRGDVAGAVAEDIRRIYLNRSPLASADVIKEKYRIIFRQPFRNGMLEYIFAGPERHLVQKSYYEAKKKIWSVFYYEHTLKDNKLYPRGIILKHYQYHYQLIVRLKEIRA